MQNIFYIRPIVDHLQADMLNKYDERNNFTTAHLYKIIQNNGNVIPQFLVKSIEIYMEQRL